MIENMNNNLDTIEVNHNFDKLLLVVVVRNNNNLYRLSKNSRNRLKIG